MNNNLSLKEYILINIAFLICIPSIFTGFYLCKNYGFYESIIGIFLSGIIFFMISIFFGKLSINNPGKSTIEIVNNYFYELGIILSVIGISIPMTGWFSLQINLLTDSFKEFFNFNFYFLTIILGFLMTLSVLNGIKNIKIISNFSFLIKILIIFFIYQKFNYSFFLNSIPKLNLDKNLIFFMIASLINGIIDNPTITRYMQSFKEINIGSFFIYALFFPLIIFSGVFLAKIFPNLNFMESIYKIIDNNIWKYSVLIFMITGTFVINSANLFSAATAISSFKNFKISYLKSVILIGIIGTLLSCFNIIDYFSQTLDFISIITVSMGTILIFNDNLKNKFSKKSNTFQLILSIILTFLFSFLKLKFLTNYIFINSFLITLFVNIFTLIFYKTNK